MKFRKFVSALLALIVLISAVPAFEITAFAANMPYRIGVDLTNQIVTIYSNETNQIVRQFLCSSGAKDATPTGTYVMPERENVNERKEWFYFGEFGTWAKYATRVYKGIMFHSLLYSKQNMSTLSRQSVADYGKPASHGCMRLRWQDAEFIAKNCLKGTVVKIYKSGEVDEELRELLYQASYTGENGQTYDQFLGIPQEEGVMGRFSKGDDVKNLQMRLRDLGLFSDDITGDYRGATVTAVRTAQSMLGMEQTGVASLEFQDAIYSSDAPSAMNVLLQEGMSGPAVRSLQENLAALRLYTGNIDTVYDVDVVEAVRSFQSAYGYTTDGVASSEIQKAIYYEAGRLKALFALDEGYSMEKLDAEIYMGRVNCEVGIHIREKPSKESRDVGKLREGDVVVAVEPGDEWSKIMRGKITGYVKNYYVDYYRQDISALRYTSDNGNHEYTIGYTAEDYFDGASRPVDVFSAYLTSGGSLDAYEGLTNYATVKTDSDDITLNLREAPTIGSAILAALANGTDTKVKLRSSEWTMVECDGMTGYLLNDYLEFWIGPDDVLGADDALAAEPEEAEPEVEPRNDDAYAIEHALVSCDTADRAAVYAEDSADAEVLGQLGNGIRIEVLRTIDGWSYISYQGRNGYMREEDLQFFVEGIEV